MMNLKIKNALISVSNKENLVSLLKTLKKFNVNKIKRKLIILNQKVLIKIK